MVIEVFHRRPALKAPAHCGRPRPRGQLENLIKLHCQGRASQAICEFFHLESFGGFLIVRWVYLLNAGLKEKINSEEARSGWERRKGPARAV